MKYALILLLSMCTFAEIEETMVRVINCELYNSVWEHMDEEEINISYSEDELGKYFMLYLPGYYVTTALSLVSMSKDQQYRDKLITILDKFLEWEKKALEMKVELSKDIDTKYFGLGYKSNTGEEWKIVGQQGVLFKFISDSPNKHYLCIKPPQLDNILTNDPVFISGYNVKLLKRLLSDEAMKIYAKEINKKQNIENAFQ